VPWSHICAVANILCNAKKHGLRLLQAHAQQRLAQTQQHVRNCLTVTPWSKLTRGGATCFSDYSAFTINILIRFAKVHLSYASNLHSTWEFGSVSVANPARPLNLNSHSSGPLRRNHNANELAVA
jgi:hypothetical protein